MTETSIQLLEGGGLQVRFALCDDRYAHEILLADSSGWIPILSSVEGSPSDKWPASPPLQSLHLERRPGNRQLALLVGMAGNSHWSMSVELDPSASRATFDIACRMRAGAADWLGSRYQAAWPPTELRASRAIFASSATPARLGLEICQRFGDARLESHAPLIDLIASRLSSSEQPQTIRWGYALSRGCDSSSS